MRYVVLPVLAALAGCHQPVQPLQGDTSGSPGGAPVSLGQAEAVRPALTQALKGVPELLKRIDPRRRRELGFEGDPDRARVGRIYRLSTIDEKRLAAGHVVSIEALHVYRALVRDGSKPAMLGTVVAAPGGARLAGIGASELAGQLVEAESSVGISKVVDRQLLRLFGQRCDLLRLRGSGQDVVVPLGSSRAVLGLRAAMGTDAFISRLRKQLKGAGTP